jgi:hypothetical protein
MLKTLLIAALALGADAALAQVMYRYKDAAGNAVFSDQPPPRGTPYTVQGSAQPSANPSVPVPSVQQPSVQQPSAPLPAGPTLPPGAPAGSVRDRDAFVPQGERRLEREAVREFTPTGEPRQERQAVREFVPQGEAARERRDLQTGVPAGEAARQRRDMQIGVPADELRREQEATRLNQ